MWRIFQFLLNTSFHLMKTNHVAVRSNLARFINQNIRQVRDFNLITMKLRSIGYTFPDINTCGDQEELTVRNNISRG